MLKTIVGPALIGGVLLLLSLALPQQVTTKEELSAVRFGLPLWFIEQDTTAVNRAVPTPVWIGVPQGNPTTIDWERLVASWVILAVVVGLVRYALFGGRPSFSA